MSTFVRAPLFAAAGAFFALLAGQQAFADATAASAADAQPVASDAPIHKNVPNTVPPADPSKGARQRYRVSGVGAAGRFLYQPDRNNGVALPSAGGAFSDQRINADEDAGSYGYEQLRVAILPTGGAKALELAAKGGQGIKTQTRAGCGFSMGLNGSADYSATFEGSFNTGEGTLDGVIKPLALGADGDLICTLRDTVVMFGADASTGIVVADSRLLAPDPDDKRVRLSRSVGGHARLGVADADMFEGVANLEAGKAWTGDQDELYLRGTAAQRVGPVYLGLFVSDRFMKTDRGPDVVEDRAAGFVVGGAFY